MVKGGLIRPNWNTTPKWRKIEFPSHTDERGSLSVAQLPDTFAVGPTEDELPFTPARVYWLHNLTGDSTRGEHATFDSEQIIIPLRGSFTINLTDGRFSDAIDLSAPSPGQPAVGLHLYGGVWRDLDDFMDTTIVLCMSSTRYEDTDYVRDRLEFEKRVAEERHAEQVAEALDVAGRLDPR